MTDTPPSSLDLDHVRYYLRLHDWSLTKADDLKEIWTSPNVTRVVVPRVRLSDYESLLNEAVVRISGDEDRDPDDVAIELSWPGYDKLLARTRADRSTPAVSLQEGLSLHTALRDLIVAAARSSEQRLPSFRGGWSATVGTYFDQVRMIPSEPGSFVLRALLPLNPEPPAELLFETVQSTSIRAVTRTLLSGITAAKDAAQQRAAGASEAVFEEAVEQGVSADMLDAIVRLGGAPEDPAAVELNVAWTYAAPAPPSAPIRIEPGLLPVLEQGADILRGAPEEAEATVTGVVVRLHRQPLGGPGQVTIQGFVESSAGSSSRNLKMELDEVTYGLAIAAHRDGATVRVRCTIRYGGVRLVVTHVEDFTVVPGAQD